MVANDADGEDVLLLLLLRLLTRAALVPRHTDMPLVAAEAAATVGGDGVGDAAAVAVAVAVVIVEVWLHYFL